MTLTRAGGWALLAVGLLAAGVVLTGSAPRGPAQTRPGGPPGSDQAPTADGRVASPPVGGLGQDIRYLDEDGQIKHLGVQDFPR